MPGFARNVTDISTRDKEVIVHDRKTFCDEVLTLVKPFDFVGSINMRLRALDKFRNLC